MAILLGVVLGVMPLLPTGPGYLGAVRVNYIDAGLVGLFALWCAVRFRTRGRVCGTDDAGAAVQRSWAIFLATAGGAAVLGLAAENRVSSPVFWAHVNTSASQLLWPESLIFDPFYPARVWIVLARGLLAFFLVRDLCRRGADPPARARTALVGWLGGFAAVSGLALAQYLTEYGLHPFWVAANPELTRAHATLDDPNSLASYLVLGIGLAWGLALANVPRSAASRLGFAVALLGAAALATTVSRAAWAALPLALALTMASGPEQGVGSLLPTAPRAGRIARILLAAAALGVIGLTAARALLPEIEAPEPSSPVEAIAQTLDPRTPLDQVLRGRLVLWGAALRMAADHPVTGVGLGRYPRLLLPYVAPEWTPPENAHAFLLQIWAEAGSIGLLACLVFFVAVVGTLIRARQAGDAASAALAAGALAGVGGFLISSLSGHPLLLSSGQVLFGTAIAAALTATASAGAGTTTATIDARPARRGSRRNLVAALACSFAVVLFLAAAARATPPPRPTSEWGYAWGLLPEEWGHFPEAWGRYLVDSGFELDDPTRQPFRWSREQALLELAPAAGTSSCALRFVPPLPTRSGVAQQLTISYGGTRETVAMERSEPYLIRIPVTVENLNDDGLLLVAFGVDPVFVPADTGTSADRRRLGVHVLRPICEP